MSDRFGYILRAIGFVVSHVKYCMGNFYWWHSNILAMATQAYFIHWNSDSFSIQNGKLCAQSAARGKFLDEIERQAVQGKTISKMLDLYHQYVWLCLCLRQQSILCLTRSFLSYCRHREHFNFVEIKVEWHLNESKG